MKEITLLAKVDASKCRGCTVCQRVCPVHAISAGEATDWIANVDSGICMGCASCEQRCPHYAIEIVKRPDPYTVQVEVTADIRKQVDALCRKARLNPKQVLCYCVGVRAEEVAAAIIAKGATKPEEISRATGIRMGCSIECIQPILRMLSAAGFEPVPDEEGWQWYGKTVTVWDIPEEVKKKYNSRGFYFDEDRHLMDKIVAVETKGGAGK